jgi:hypothetical protein
MWMSALFGIASVVLLVWHFHLDFQATQYSQQKSVETDTKPLQPNKPMSDYMPSEPKESSDKTVVENKHIEQEDIEAIFRMAKQKHTI